MDLTGFSIVKYVRRFIAISSNNNYIFSSRSYVTVCICVWNGFLETKIILYVSSVRGNIFIIINIKSCFPYNPHSGWTNGSVNML